MVTYARLSHILMLLALLLAFALRSYQLDAQSLRGDEAATVLYAAMPPGELWELSRITDPHPPLYYALLHPWQWLLGDSAWAMRYVGVMAGVLAVAALYRLARVTLAAPPIALLAAALLAVNPLQIWLAQDIRSYPLFTLLGLLSSWALWAALTEQPATTGTRANAARYRQTGRWLLYVLLSVTSLYTHYYTVFLIAFQGLWALFNAKRFWGQKWPWLAAQIAIALLIIPGLLLAANFIGGEAGGGVAVAGLPEIVRRTAAALLTGFTLDATTALWLSVLLLPLWLAGLAHLLRLDATTGSFWALYFAAPTVGVIALAIDRPFFKERFLIQAQPAFLLLLAAGIVWAYSLRVASPGGLRRVAAYGLRLLAAMALALLLLANLTATANYHTDPVYAKAPPWRLYHNFVRDQAKPGDVMLTNFPEAAISYYSPDGLPFYVVPAERGHTAAELAEQAAQIAGAYQRIWFLPMLQEGFDERGDVLNWLDRHTDRTDQIFFPAYNLNLYLGPAAIEQAMLPRPARFGHGIALRGYQILDRRGKSRLSGDAAPPLITLKPEEDFTLSLYWQADVPPGEDYTVFVHLVAADGFTRTSRDNPPVWGSYPTSQWQPGEQVVDRYTLEIPPGTPPGDHRLRVGWYNPATGQRVTLPNGQDSLLLKAVVRVEQ